MRDNTRHAVVILSVLAAVLAVFASGPMPQPLDYHQFADQRSFFGIPNFLNVVSNVPFAIAGLLGLRLALGKATTGGSRFADSWERWPWTALFTGVLLTTIGSTYYHLAPDNARLVWDRMPMTVGFMGLLSALLAERVSVSAGRKLLLPLLITGAASVGYWYWSETQGASDQRFYILVQYGSLLLVVLMLSLYPARYRGTGYIVAALALYAAAKFMELGDAEILSMGQIVSGHTLKHFAAAAGVALLAMMLGARSADATVISGGGSGKL